ncbi:uncharacterized protein LOC133921904 [Phragmites australis]|uniref:uncharacterized protein LOC133921904 n=1 Tax=Phragmites australis TaxID=29695 RepID=UPI002D785CDF|nr:uncharacterized protein LOC133921904 [Phragmites australis]
MASMMGGDFVEAYVLKNAYKEKVRRLEAAEAKSKNGGAGSGEKKAAGGSWGGGLFGLMNKKVHPKAAASGGSTGASS